MPANQLHLIPSYNFYQGLESIDQYQYQFLAQGDSWFSMSTVEHLPASSNMLENMYFSKMAAAVNCAVPGKTLKTMAQLPPTVELRRDPFFRGLLSGPKEQWWSALLLSGGANDLIDALQEYPGDQHSDLPPNDRLLRTKAEWGTQSTVEKYIMEEGWSVFVQHLVDQYVAIDQMRVASKYNKDIPIITHIYDLATPRNVGAGFGFGPWLYKALFTEYGIPQSDWSALAKEFLMRLAGIICALDKTPPVGALIPPPANIKISPLDNFHVVWTQGILTPAKITDTGATSDWENEIHPTRDGYTQLAKAMVEVIEPICDARHALALTLARSLPIGKKKKKKRQGKV